jgi:hypothetical protein
MDAGRYSSLHVAVDYYEPADFFFRRNLVSQFDQSGPGLTLYTNAPYVVNVDA